MQDTNSTLNPIFKNQFINGIEGSINEVGRFKLTFNTKSLKTSIQSYLLFHHDPFMEMNFVNQLISNSIIRKHDSEELLLIGAHKNRPYDIERPNFIAVQFTIESI